MEGPPSQTDPPVRKVLDVPLIPDLEKIRDQSQSTEDFARKLEKQRLETVHMRDLKQKMVNVVQRRMNEAGRTIRETEKLCGALEDVVKELPFEMVTLLDTDVVLDEDTALRKDPKRFREKAEDFALSDECCKVVEALCFSEKKCKFFEKWQKK